MKILTFSGSLRKDSFNKRICQAALQFVKSRNLAEIEYVDLQPLNIPLYDQDLETASGLPDGVQKLCAKIKQADALLISSPENNGSISQVLKNTLDWVSREKPVSITGKHVLLCAASSGAFGGIRGLWHSRVPFEALGCHVFPDMVGFGKVQEVLETDNQIKDLKLRAQFEKVISDFIQFVK